MRGGPRDPHPDAGPGPDPQACAEARELTGRFVGGEELGRERRSAFREHLRACEACRLEYRAAVATVARARRAQLAAGATEERRRSRQARRRRAIAGAGRGAGRWRLQLVLVPAALILLLSRLGLPGGEPSLSVHWRAGTVYAAGLALASGRQRAELGAGAWCVVDGRARAWLEGAGGRFELGADARILVEDPGRPRVRLAGGELEALGPAVVSTQLGLVELAAGGRARLRAAGDEVAVECLEGEALLLDAGQETRLGPGGRARLALGAIRSGGDPAPGPRAARAGGA